MTSRPSAGRSTSRAAGTRRCWSRSSNDDDISHDLFVGFGAVARCTLPILLRHITIDPKRITIMDFEPDDAALKPWIEQGITFVRNRVTEDNMGALLGEHLSAGDLLIDLAWNIDCCEILQWCHDRGVLYINTSVELWDPYAGAANKHPTERTLYWRHMNIRRMIAAWKEPGPTAVARARRESRPDQPLHQAGTPRHRRAGAGRAEGRRRTGGEDRATSRRRWSSITWPASSASR